MTDCTYCGCAIERHSPVHVREGDPDEAGWSGQFCNYGCLNAHIDEAGLAEGTVCQWDR